MAARYTPTPVPEDDNKPLQVYLDSEFRRVAASQGDEITEGFAVLFNATSDVVANDTTETPLVGYTDSFNTAIMDIDPVTGTITLPANPGLVEVTCWASLSQITATRNFTVQLVIEVAGVWQAPILSSGYIPQNGVSVKLGLSASFIRDAPTGGSTLRLGLLLDGASPATFAVDDSTFQVRYVTLRG